MAETKYIVFSLNNQKYSMQLTRINGIECVYNIIPVPMGAACIKGIIHLRDMVVPVYSLKQHFDLEDIPGANPQLLVTESHGIRLAFEVDDVLGIVPVPDADVKSVPTMVHTQETGYLENVVRLTLPEMKTPEIMISISVDNIMSEREFGQVADAIEKTKQDEE